MIRRALRSSLSNSLCSAVAVAIALFSLSIASAQQDYKVEQLFRPGDEARSPAPRRVFSFDVKGDEIEFLEMESGRVIIAAKGPKAAVALRTMKNTYQFTRLEMFQTLGGTLKDAPAALQAELTNEIVEQNADRRFPSIDAILSVENTVTNVACDPSDPNSGCGGLGFIEAGALTSGVTNVCFRGVAVPAGEVDTDFEDWEFYLGATYIYPFSDLDLGRFDSLGAHLARDEIGKGEWSRGDADIVIPPTTSGGILVCNRHPTNPVCAPRLIVQEELFPGAWFHLFETAAAQKGTVYGIVFKGTTQHNRIRVIVRDFENSDISTYPPGCSTAEEDRHFWWAATY